jgi:hypothetical protein
MASFIRLVLSNFTLTFLVLGFIVSGTALARAAKPLTMAAIIEALLAYFSPVLDRLELFLQFRHAHILRGHGGALHRLAG